MEKQRIKSGSKLCRRLLSYFLTFTFFSTVSIFAQTFITPVENQDMFTKTDLKFEALIPNVKATQVQIKSPQDQPDINFITFRKSDDYENNGTKLELWLSFDKKGVYQLNPLSVTIRNKRYNLRFQQIVIKENPANLIPRLVFTFSDGTQVFSDEPVKNIKPVTSSIGEKIKFTVNLQYAVQLVQFEWDLPTESILHQTETYEITEVKYREKTYSEDLIPVASFEWTILQPGTRKIPKFHLTTTGYNGHKYDLYSPEYQINCISLQNSDSLPEDSSFDTAFEDAFSETSEGKQNSKIQITEEHCSMLAFLRQNERNAMFNYFSAVRERSDYETHIGLPAGESEFPVAILYFSTFTILLFLTILIIMIVKKTTLPIIVFSILLVSSIVFHISSIVKKNKTFAISLGITVKSIPDEKASSNQSVVAGTRVQINETAGKWSYIEIGNIGGWCETENLIIIR